MGSDQMPLGRQGQISQSFTYKWGLAHTIVMWNCWYDKNSALNWATLIPDETLALGTAHRGPVFSSVGTALSN